MSRVSRARRSKDAAESSKMSGIINAHKPMPLSDLFHSAATPETVESIARRKKHKQLGLGLLLLIVLLGAASVVYKHVSLDDWLLDAHTKKPGDTLVDLEGQVRQQQTGNNHGSASILRQLM